MSFIKKIAKNVPTKSVSKVGASLASNKKTISAFASKASTAIKKIDPKKAALAAVVVGGAAVVAANSCKPGQPCDFKAGINTTVSDATGIVKDSAGIVVSGAGDIASGALDTVGGVASGALSGIFDFIKPYIPIAILIAAIIAFVYIRSIFR